MSLTLPSAAKINLHLRVGSVDAAGYHPLRSWMITTTLQDELTFERASRRLLTCDDAGLPCDASNLVWKAADAILRRAQSSDEVAIHLAKRIPAGAGLGGGSSNAATTLVGINRLLNLGLSRDDLTAIAATLGSDVPFFLGPPSAIATGRGEILEPAPVPQRARFATLILPSFPISTAAAYRMLDVLRPTPASDILSPFDVATFAAEGARSMAIDLENDLAIAAFAVEPRLKTLSDELAYHAFGSPPLMSGSGSTLFVLRDDADEAARAAAVAEHVAGEYTVEIGPIRTICVELGNPSGFFD